MADLGASCVKWELHYSGLTDAEWQAVQDLFESVEGQLNSFTFLDPTDNLLAWSEDWTRSVWSADPLLQVSAGIPGPSGLNDGTRIINQAQTTQRIMQATQGASGFRYSFSLFVRSDVASTPGLIIKTAGEEAAKTIVADNTWRRANISTSLAPSGDGVSFGIQLVPGGALDVFGAQVEAQPAVGGYKRTLDRAGVYPNTRFDSDILRRIGEQLNQNSCVIKLFSRLS
jgi:hypothetical protein